MDFLLIDNYDSFTFNLHHMLAEASGTDGLVLRNDDIEGWRSIDLGRVGAIVISPGPGRPDQEGDFGISRAALATDVPVLGVCLGHQGLGHAEGGLVVQAPTPVHGRVSPVEHDGTGLFAGLPSPFPAVRYHSLVLVDVPPSLRVTATTSDGDRDLVMAVEHRTRPQWGVQFHPESFLTAHGAQVVSNFLALAQEARPRRPRVGSGSRRVATTARGPRDLVAVRLPVEADGERLHERLWGDDIPSVWLDSSSTAAGRASHSILGGRGPLGELVTAEVGAGLRIETRDGRVRHEAASIFDYLAEQTAARAATVTGLRCDFTLGYVGYLGYEMKAECGGEAAHTSDLPDSAFVLCDRAVVIDHDLGQTWLLALSAPEIAGETDAWLAWAEHEVRMCVGTGTPVAPPRPRPMPITARNSRAEYHDLVKRSLAEIAVGETYEVCLTTTFTAEAEIDPLATYRELRRRNPVPYGALLRLPGVDVLCASPERFLKISAEGWVEAKPIKGTRPRGATAEEDAALVADLAGAEKDSAENLMILDLLRNDLGSVSEIGSVHVPTAFQVESYATVHQLVSTIRSRLRPDVSAPACVRAAFPGGSMTGAPKRRTMRIIDDLEEGSRGVYSGAIGYFSLSGAADLNIVIRTIVARGHDIRVGAGGAVVALSHPEDEAEETLLKASLPLDVVRTTALERPRDRQDPEEPGPTVEGW